MPESLKSLPEIMVVEGGGGWEELQAEGPRHSYKLNLDN